MCSTGTRLPPKKHWHTRLWTNNCTQRRSCLFGFHTFYTVCRIPSIPLACSYSMFFTLLEREKIVMLRYPTSRRILHSSRFHFYTVCRSFLFERRFMAPRWQALTSERSNVLAGSMISILNGNFHWNTLRYNYALLWILEDEATLGSFDEINLGWSC